MKKKRDTGIAFGIRKARDGDFWNFDFDLLPSITMYFNGYRGKGISDIMITFSWLFWWIQIYSFKD